MSRITKLHDRSWNSPDVEVTVSRSELDNLPMGHPRRAHLERQIEEQERRNAAIRARLAQPTTPTPEEV